MPNAIVAGVPPQWLRQVRAALDRLDTPHWSFTTFPSKGAREVGVELASVPLLQSKAHELDGAHILAFGGRNRNEIAQDLRTHFRMRWLSSETLRAATANLEPFVEELQIVLAEEDSWRAALHPIDKRSALTLPQHGFVAVGGLPNIWALCEAFNKEEGFFQALVGHLERFSALYRKKWDNHSQRFFIDDKSRVWKDEGPYHGTAPFPRDWKYSSLLPPKFHYDVQHERGQAFEYVGRDGRSKSVAANRHCNVDAHGYLR